MTKDKHTRITGVGNALVDILLNESDEFFTELGEEKGGMILVEDKHIEKILSRSKQDQIIVPGGAACNTLAGVAKLNGDARFIGKRGDDDYGSNFELSLVKSGVEPLVAQSESPTGKVLSIITPDAQRSMFTFLGAATELDPESIVPEMFKDTAIAVIEGYLLFNQDLIMASLKAAKKAGSLIALDLASFQVVKDSKEILNDIIKDYVDILIANEDEAKEYTGIDDEQKSIEKMALNVTYAVLKVGSRGSFVSYNNKIIPIAPVSGKEPKDTTGAGDLWAAGFLFGLAHGFSIQKSGRIASACGYEACQVIGAHLPEDAWTKIKTMI